MTMTESVIADFVGEFVVDGDGHAEPDPGRVLLSTERLVLASDHGRVTVKLSSIFDVAVGTVPADSTEFFNPTVTVGFARDDDRHVAVIESGPERIEKFSTVLFKTQLHGLAVAVTHPARRGGRVTDEPVREATMQLESPSRKRKRWSPSTPARNPPSSSTTRVRRHWC